MTPADLERNIIRMRTERAADACRADRTYHATIRATYTLGDTVRADLAALRIPADGGSLRPAADLARSAQEA